MVRYPQRAAWRRLSGATRSLCGVSTPMESKPQLIKRNQIRPGDHWSHFSNEKHPDFICRTLNSDEAPVGLRSPDGESRFFSTRIRGDERWVFTKMVGERIWLYHRTYICACGALAILGDYLCSECASRV